MELLQQQCQDLATKTKLVKTKSELSLRTLTQQLNAAQSKIQSCTGGSCSEENPCGGSCADRVREVALSAIAQLGSQLEPLLAELLRLQTR